MPTYFIGYDLHEGEDYSALTEAIKEMAPCYWRHLDSTWLIVHEGPATLIRDTLLPYLERYDKPKTENKRAGDKLLVAKLSGEGAWTASFSGTWLKKYL